MPGGSNATTLAALRRPLRWLPMGCVLAGALACANGAHVAEQIPVARVSGADVYERDVRVKYEQRVGALPAAALPPESKQALWQQCLDDAVQEQMIEAAAREAHIVVLEDEVDGYVQRLKRADASVSSETSTRLAPSEMRQAARAYLLLGKYVAYQVAARVEVSEDDLLAYAEAHPEVLTRPALMRLRFLRLPNTDHIASLRQSVARGKAPADAASEAWGRHVEVGDLGPIAVDRLPEEVRTRTERLALRKLSEPLSLGSEVAIFWVSERLPASKESVPAARRRIERRLKREREVTIEQQVLAELKSAAHPEILHAAMPQDI